MLFFKRQSLLRYWKFCSFTIVFNKVTTVPPFSALLIGCHCLKQNYELKEKGLDSWLTCSCSHNWSKSHLLYPFWGNKLKAVPWTSWSHWSLATDLDRTRISYPKGCFIFYYEVGDLSGHRGKRDTPCRHLPLAQVHQRHSLLRPHPNPAGWQCVSVIATFLYWTVTFLKVHLFR